MNNLEELPRISKTSQMIFEGLSRSKLSKISYNFDVMGPLSRLVWRNFGYCLNGALYKKNTTEKLEPTYVPTRRERDYIEVLLQKTLKQETKPQESQSPITPFPGSIYEGL